MIQGMTVQRWPTNQTDWSKIQDPGSTMIQVHTKPKDDQPIKQKNQQIDARSRVQDPGQVQTRVPLLRFYSVFPI